MCLYKTGTDPEERHKIQLVQPHGTTLVYLVQFEAFVLLQSSVHSPACAASQRAFQTQTKGQNEMNQQPYVCSTIKDLCAKPS